MFYVYRFRLYPNKEQVKFLNRQIGHCRFVYNKLLEMAKEAYEKERRKWNYYEYKKLLPKLKKEFSFLKEANSQSLQEAVKWLDKAFKNFFKGLAKFPKFKSKKRTNSVSIPQHFCIEGNRAKIPKLKKPIRFIKHREIDGKIKSITITKTPSGKFYLNVLVDREIEPLPKTKKVVAIDVGLTTFCTLSSGKKIEKPKHLIESERKLKKLQRQLSRKKVDSQRFLKLRKRIAKLHEKIRNQRDDFLHKLSKRIIGDNQAVIVEDLNVKGMVKNLRLAKYITDASWRKFLWFLEYKAKLYGRELIKVDTFFPSSKLCSRCGYKNKELKLSDREWICPKCGTKHDRDVNATLNLLKEGFTRLKRVVGVDCSELMPVEGAVAPCEAGSPSF
ncbi:IS200/IS605 family element RNA-guided endonuclease TnpB [Desulfurobacterium thermolithotrophum]|uniref:IS200/IS605 family element RNA-guided endonuclease TnpB n=1 Tax=Desulfurobacterium thermolithotrophum TaxID=64160 RepID=UPI0013CFB774|nr:IS200/IS605 family element RNA-guided endonuclease TnpB [Desulfurobacterium thermolithotrophum]